MATALAVVGVGCGANQAPTRHDALPASASARGLPARAVTTTRPASVYGGPAPLLIYFKRVVGLDPVASQLTVDTNGSASAVITLGGIDGAKKHDFTMTPAQLRPLRMLIAKTRLRNTGCCDARYYFYFLSVHGRTWRLQQRSVPRSIRPLIDELDAITDAHTSY